MDRLSSHVRIRHSRGPYIALSILFEGTGVPARNITITDAVLAKAAPSSSAKSQAGRRRQLLAPAASSNYSATDVSAEIALGSLAAATDVQSALSTANLKVSI